MTTAPANTGPVAEALNRSARRIFQAERQAEWSAAVVDAALGFCERAALFTVQGARLRLDRASFESSDNVSLLPAEAPAVAHALESLEPVVAAWSVRELSAALVDCFGTPRGGRVSIFPVPAVGRSIALLVTDGGDPNGLELVCSVAGAAWELRRQRNESKPAASIGLISVTPVAVDGEWHQRARRFASVRVAELRLYQAAKVREGRESRKIYEMFQQEIDHERAIFRTQFMEKSASMVDYLHEEMVRTLAQGEPDRMGENYPGEMVHR